MYQYVYACKYAIRYFNVPLNMYLHCLHLPLRDDAFVFAKTACMDAKVTKRHLPDSIKISMSPSDNTSCTDSLILHASDDSSHKKARSRKHWTNVTRPFWTVRYMFSIGIGTHKGLSPSTCCIWTNLVQLNSISCRYWSSKICCRSKYLFHNTPCPESESYTPLTEASSALKNLTPRTG